jgi:Skp family chaperone for outer membrane proteins
MFIKFFLACALLLSVSIDISLIRYGEYKDFDASRKDKIAVVNSKKIYMTIPEYKIIKKEKIGKETARYFALMKVCTTKYRTAIKSFARDYVLVVEVGGVQDYPTTDITSSVIERIK